MVTVALMQKVPPDVANTWALANFQDKLESCVAAVVNSNTGALRSAAEIEARGAEVVKHISDLGANRLLNRGPDYQDQLRKWMAKGKSKRTGGGGAASGNDDSSQGESQHATAGAGSAVKLKYNKPTGSDLQAVEHLLTETMHSTEGGPGTLKITKTFPT